MLGLYSLRESLYESYLHAGEAGSEQWSEYTSLAAHFCCELVDFQLLPVQGEWFVPPDGEPNYYSKQMELSLWSEEDGMRGHTFVFNLESFKLSFVEWECRPLMIGPRIVYQWDWDLCQWFFVSGKIRKK